MQGAKTHKTQGVLKRSVLGVCSDTPVTVGGSVLVGRSRGRQGQGMAGKRLQARDGKRNGKRACDGKSKKWQARGYQQGIRAYRTLPRTYSVHVGWMTCLENDSRLA
eukprot:1157694-Pelagomonas_calceolata.AAC.20